MFSLCLVIVVFYSFVRCRLIALIIMDEFEIFGVLYLLGQHAVMEKNSKIIKRRKFVLKKKAG
jgi:hypothetical protein